MKERKQAKTLQVGLRWRAPPPRLTDKAGTGDGGPGRAGVRSGWAGGTEAVVLSLAYMVGWLMSARCCCLRSNCWVNRKMNKLMNACKLRENTGRTSMQCLFWVAGCISQGFLQRNKTSRTCILPSLGICRALVPGPLPTLHCPPGGCQNLQMFKSHIE